MGTIWALRSPMTRMKTCNARGANSSWYRSIFSSVRRCCSVSTFMRLVSKLLQEKDPALGVLLGGEWADG